jgi:dCMP deaminase
LVREPWDIYFLKLATLVSTRSNCCRRHYGAVIVRDKAVVSTGYNGTPSGVQNCIAGGCPRCNSDTPPGEGYDRCICVHAEANAILLAAKHGIDTKDTTMYCIARPCLSCMKEIIQSGISTVRYYEWYDNNLEVEEAYGQLIPRIKLVRHFLEGRELTRSQMTTWPG